MYIVYLLHVDCTCRIQREPARVMNNEVGVNKPVEEPQHLHQMTQNISKIYLEYIRGLKIYLEFIR